MIILISPDKGRGKKAIFRSLQLVMICWPDKFGAMKCVILTKMATLSKFLPLLTKELAFSKFARKNLVVGAAPNLPFFSNSLNYSNPCGCSYACSGLFKVVAKKIENYPRFKMVRDSEVAHRMVGLCPRSQERTNLDISGVFLPCCGSVFSMHVCQIFLFFYFLYMLILVLQI